MDGNTSGGEFDRLDSLYIAVIRNSMADQAPDSILNMRRSIGAIVTISTKQPVPIEVLCRIMQPHIKPGVLKNVVGRLGAVLYSDAQLAGAIRVLHPSFADFALDQSRSTVFWVDPIQRNIELSIGCLSTMEQELKFNICQLETSHLFNSEVPDLESKIEAGISGQLAYSCVYWISHLVKCDDEVVASRVANIIDNPRLLYWLEVLSVLQRVDVALEELRELSRWLMPYQREIAHYIWDAYRFVLAFSDPIIASTPHIYISALPLAPKQSEVSRRLLPLFPHTATVVRGGDKIWPEWLRSTLLPAPLRPLYLSRDSQRLVVSTCKGVGTSTVVSMLDLRTGRLLRVIEHPSEDQPELVAISADGGLITTGSALRGITFWDADTTALIHSARIPDLKDFEEIQAWAFSPDGNALRLLIAVGNSNQRNKITLWEIEPRKAVIVPLLEVDEDRGMAVAAFSPDGDRIAICSRTGRLVIYSLSNPTNTTQFNLKSGHTVDVIAFSPNGAFIAAALNTRAKYSESAGVQIWDTKTGASVGTFMEHTPLVLSIAFSSDGAQIVTCAGENGKMQIWDTKTCNAIGSPFGVHTGHNAPGKIRIFFAPDDTHVLSGSFMDTKIRMWDASPTSTYIDNHIDTAYTPVHSDKVGFILFSQDGTYIISGSNDCTVRTWDAQTGVLIEKSASLNYPIKQIALSPDGTRRMVVTDRKYKLYTWDSREVGHKQLSIKDEVSAFALSPDGNQLVNTWKVYGQQSKMVAWDMNTGKKIKELDLTFGQSFPNFLSFSLDGSYLFSYHRSLSKLVPTCSWKTPKFAQTVHIWDPETYDLVGYWVTDPMRYPHVNVHAVSADATRLVASHATTIFIHDAHTGDICSTLLYYGDPSSPLSKNVNCVVFSPNGLRIASSHRDGVIRLWDVTSGAVLGDYMFRYPSAYFQYQTHSLAFSPDGTKLVSGLENGEIQLWDVGSTPDLWDNGDASQWPSNTGRFPPHPIHSGWVSHDQRSLTLWLPDHYQRQYEPNLVLRISNEPMVHVDFSKFVHGTEWTSVISEETLRSCRRVIDV